MQLLLSLQVTAEPLQTPPEQVSFEVQALPSLQAAVLLVVTQPVAGLHELSVQGLASVQVRAEPKTQSLLRQISNPLHALLSSH